MRVTITEELVDYEYTCSQSADEIHEAVQSGKTAVLVWDDYIYSLMISTETKAVFGYIDTEDRCFSCFAIYNNAKIAYLSVVDYPNYDAGQLELGSEPTQRNHAANKDYVDNAVKGKAYELIETITLEENSTITRSQEPNGKPYNFKQIYLALKTNAQGKSGWLLFKNGNTTIGTCYMGGGKADATSYNAIAIRPETGFWRTTWSNWGVNDLVVNSQAYANERAYYPIKGVDEYPAITSFILQAELTAGTEIQIWGVRADA